MQRDDRMGYFEDATWGSCCFNPHPARRPGATCGSASFLRRPSRFQSSPGQKAGCNAGLGVPRHQQSVSILTRPEGRVQPPTDRKCACGFVMVSILTRPEGRVQPAGLRQLDHRGMFQSSPGQKAGCNLPLPAQSRPHRTCFNPHRARRPGATRESRGSLGRSRLSFNPHPARRPGATHRHVAHAVPTEFQSSPGQKAGCNP